MDSRIFAAAVFLVLGSAGAQEPGQTWYRNTREPPTAISCDRLPDGSVKAMPAPLNRYMRFACNNQMGEGVLPASGLHWTDARGRGIELSSSNPDIPLNAAGLKVFPFGWYTRFAPANHTATERKALLAVFQRKFKPDFPADADIVEADAQTSSGQQKRIFLILPAPTKEPPNWLVGLECNGACFTEDRQPLVFFGAPNK